MNHATTILCCAVTVLSLFSVAESACGFSADGVFYENSIVLEETTDVDVLSDGSCGTLLIVAVGGGGTTQRDAGSGSGYIRHAEVSPPPSSGQFRAEVGGAQEATELTDRTDGREAIQYKSFWLEFLLEKRIE